MKSKRGGSPNSIKSSRMFRNTPGFYTKQRSISILKARSRREERRSESCKLQNYKSYKRTSKSPAFAAKIIYADIADM